MFKMERRTTPSINAGSMADIAFLLLIFFLIATTVNRDEGILRVLAPKDDGVAKPIHDSHVYEVFVNDENELMVEGRSMSIADLANGARAFLTDQGGMRIRRLVTKESCLQKLAYFEHKTASVISGVDAQLRESKVDKWQRKLAAVELIGSYQELPSDAVILLRTGSGTSYGTYVQVQDELERAVRQLRDEFCQEHFGVLFNELNKRDPADQEKIRATRLVYPRRISEEDPFNMKE